MGGGFRSGIGPDHGRPGDSAVVVSGRRVPAGDYSHGSDVPHIVVARRHVQGRWFVTEEPWDAWIACSRRQASWRSPPRLSPRPFWPSRGPPAFRRSAPSATWAARSRDRQRRSRRAAVGRDGVDHRRHDGDDGHRRGRPLLASRLPEGDYTLRAHLAGFAASRRENVRVGAAAPRSTACSSIASKRRRHDRDGRTRHRAADPGRRLRPAVDRDAGHRGVRQGSTRTRHRVAAPPSPAQHPQGFSQRGDRRRRRRLQPRRSALRRGAPGAAAVAGSFLADLPFTGEVNLLTTGAFAPGGGLFSGDMLPRGVAYLAIGAPTPAGDWACGPR